MSNITYMRLWTEIQDAINDILQNEVPATLTADVTPLTKPIIYQNLCTVYVKYIQVLRKLDVCYDQTVHPQKRILIRKALDAVMGRIIEVYGDMVEFKSSECHYFDDILIDLKLSMNDLEIAIPKYFLFERALELQERERILDEILEKMATMALESEEDAEEMSNEPERVSVSSAPTGRTIIDVVVILQTHERARQARVKLRTLLEMQARVAKFAARKGKTPRYTTNEAATLIQKCWKGYVDRKLVHKLREEEKIFLGMKLPDSAVESSKRQLQMINLVEAHRRAIQERFMYEYEDAIVRIRDRILDREAGILQEEMQDKIRAWFHDTFAALGEYPEYPQEEEGGSLLIFEGKLPPEEVIKRMKELAEGQFPEPPPPPVEEVLDLMVQESKFVPILTEESADYENNWRKRDESKNPYQRHDESIIAEDKRRELRDQIRIIVDNAMANELERLKDALARERNVKRVKLKYPKKKAPKVKAKKREKDLTPDRSLESLYEELVVNGIIKKFPKVSMSDFYGDFNYLGTYLQQNSELDTPLSLADVRRLVTQYCILPLGAGVVHELGPPIPAVILVGSPGCGKTMLVHIVCSEAGATLFDLSAVNLVDKYPGKDGLKMLLHLVKKVGVALQPSVIVIEDTEKLFWKKIPKEEKYLDPKRLKGSMLKFLKMIAPDERIMLIGTTNDPISSDPNLPKMYEKIIVIPKPDYASRSVIWKSVINKTLGRDLQSIDISMLAKISDSYTGGAICQSVQTVLTEYRKVLHKNKPIETMEFLEILAKLEPIYKEEEDAFKIWYYQQTPLGMHFLVLTESGDAI